MMKLNNIMSSALASAKRKRAPPELSQPANNRNADFSQSTMNGKETTTPMPLGKVISILNTRICDVETKLKDISSTATTTQNDVKQISTNVSENVNVPSNLAETLSEYENRFDILAEEVANIKNIVLSLQSYTMEVNKMLLEERIRLLSSTSDNLGEFGEKEKEIELHENDSDSQYINTNVEELQTKLSNSIIM
jgi:hypothetical protein